MTDPGDQPSPLKIVVSSQSERLEDAEPMVRRHSIEELPSAPPPALDMPSTRLNPVEVPTLEEVLFDLEGDLWGEEATEKCRQTLEAVLGLVPCEAGSIVRGSLNDEHLVVEAAIGPVASQLRGRQQSFGSGLVGFCFDQKETVRIDDVQASDYHFRLMDEEAGFVCERALCVPVLDGDGLVYGVIELLNPTSKSFVDEDEEVVERVAQVLARALAED